MAGPLNKDPEGFLEAQGKGRLVLDEIHRLDDPAKLLKLAHDHYPGLHILATGSSTLAASAKFKDTLTGRKHELWLTPLCSQDLGAAGVSLQERLLRGGLPAFVLGPAPSEKDLQEWLDSFFAKDVTELFRVAKASPFRKFTELMLARSGGIFDASRFASDCGVDFKTIQRYLSILEATHVALVLSPFSSGRAGEIVRAARVYGFDTGFVSWAKGWQEPGPDEYGVLWEHYVLNEIMARLQTKRIHYWRDKKDHEVDFVLKRRGQTAPIAIECKWSGHSAKVAGLAAFSRAYPQAELYFVAPEGGRSLDIGGREVPVLNLEGLVEKLPEDLS